MNSRSPALWLGPLLVLVLAMSAACDAADPTASSDWTIEVSANPASLELAPGEFGQSTITARVVDDNGLPRAGVGVRFSTSAGTMASGGGLIETNASGVARDTLTTDRDATVTATSGSIDGIVTVATGALAPPVPSITITPAGQATTGATVTFAGTDSTDDDGQIVLYTWAIVSDSPDTGKPNPDVESTANAAGITRVYSGPQNLDVTLEVTDNDGLKSRTFDAYIIVAAPAPPLAGARS